MNIEDLRSLTPGFQLDNNSPISVTEANALRDRQKSILNLLIELKIAISELQTKVSSLSSRAEDSKELSNQFNSLATRVNDMAASHGARLSILETKTEK